MIVIVFDRSKITARLLRNGQVVRSLSGIPVIALRKPKRPSHSFSSNAGMICQFKAIAFGKDAESYSSDDQQDVFCCKPFDHDRVFCCHFEGAVLLVRHFMKQVDPGWLRLLRPRVMIQPLGLRGQTMTDFESRSVMELGLKAGAREAYAVDPDIDLTNAVLANLRQGTSRSNQPVQRTAYRRR